MRWLAQRSLAQVHLFGADGCARILRFAVQSVIAEEVMHRYLMDGYSTPTFNGHLDVEGYLARAPIGATAKGMFVRRLLRELSQRGLPLPTDERFFPFQDVPLATCLHINVETALTLHPGIALPEALRRLAWLSFETFADSLVGQVLLSTVSHNPHSIFELTSRALSLTTNVGRYESRRTDEQTREVRARDAYFFAECFGVGMAEGVLRACGREGWVLVRVHTPSDVEYVVHWL